ncbi:hypothetical protein DFH94DRAFT_636274 [Russula ochroleuca]|uniref:Uncharacterized protein n=1 Tax=Russula ochroleuca TaxID=152965 RepID=A0A9P5K0D3_9AGAM|nr:hypothetical protein DFH94DRAFT_636274 [Russula ochroleuca]
MSYDPDEDDSRFLSATSSSPRKLSPKPALSRNRSNASLRGGTSSLAHELAAALLPEPTTGSRLLAEEFGLEYDEGAEGIDGLPPEDVNGVPTFAISGDLDPSMVPDRTPSGSTTPAATEDDDDDDNDDDIPDATTHSHFHTNTHTLSPPRTRRQRPQHHQQQQPNHSQPEADAMALLSQNLESTEKFIGHLRRLDMDGSAPLALETLAVDIISRLNETARDREEQVRELLKYEREFQRIGAEVGGSDALASLDALEDPLAESTRSTRHLDPVAEESSFTHDWEVDPDAHLQPDDPDNDSFASSMLPSSPPPPPPLPISSGSATPAGAIPHLAHLRTDTASLVSSLSSLSEHAQVNGAATTEAGRKLRALKNRLGGWITDLDSAERSRLRIERWEADGDVEGARRVDGRAVVAEHLREFERVLFEANAKAQAIMAPA